MIDPKTGKFLENFSCGCGYRHPREWSCAYSAQVAADQRAEREARNGVSQEWHDAQAQAQAERDAAWLADRDEILALLEELDDPRVRDQLRDLREKHS